MDLRHVCDLFGGSIFPDDYRGNLTQINDEIRNIEDELNDPPLSDDAFLDDSAHAVLVRAILNIYLGEFKSAESLLKFLMSGDFGPRWQARGNAYELFLTASQEHPFLFKNSDLSSSVALAVWKDEDRVRRMHDALKYVADHMGSRELTDVDRFELQLLLHYRLYFRSLQLSWRANKARASYRHLQQMKFDLAQEIAAIEEHLPALRDTADKLGLRCTGTYIQRMIYEIALAKGSGPAEELEKMLTRYKADKDEVGCGIYWMLRGDSKISPPNTTPLAHNLDLLDSYELYPESAPLHVSLSSVSQEIWRETAIQADECYFSAAEHFMRAQASRGLCVISQRRACGLGIFNMPLSHRVSGNYQKHRESILELLGGAETLSEISGDKQQGLLLQLHRILLVDEHQVRIQRDLEDLSRSLSVAQNEVFLLCLGLLMLKHSHFSRFECGLIQRARYKYQLCASLMDSGSFEVILAQSNLAFATCCLIEGDKRMATVVNQRVKARLSKTQEQIIYGFRNQLPQYADLRDSRQQKMHATTQYVYKMITLSTITIDTQLGDIAKLSDEFTIDALSNIAKLWPSRETTYFCRHAYALLEFHKTVTSYHQLIVLARFQDAKSEILRFQTDTIREHSERDLRIKIYRIHNAIMLQQIDKAQHILSSIRDDDIFPSDSIAMGQSLFDYEKLTLERKRLSAELIFLACIAARQWARADILMAKLENLSPGFFTSMRAYSQLVPWRRCLYAGLVIEQRGTRSDYKEALRYFKQSWAFFKITISQLLTPEQRRAFYDNPDVSRLNGGICRRLICWERDGCGFWLEKTRDPRIDTRVFLVFQTEDGFSPGWSTNTVLSMIEELQAQHLLEMTALKADGSAQAYVEALSRFDSVIEWHSQSRILSAQEAGELKSLELQLEDTQYILAEATRNFKEHARDSVDDSVHNLYACLDEGCIVVYPTASIDGMALMAITAAGVVYSDWNDEISAHRLANLASNTLDKILSSKGTKPLERHLDDLQQLSNILLDPLASHLKGKEHVIFVLSGELSRLPPGLLLYDGEHLMLQKAISQVPSLTMLRRLQTTGNGEELPGTFNAIARPGSLKDYRSGSHQVPLPMSGIEAMLLASTAQGTCRDASMVSRCEFQSTLRSSQFLHISTHGQIDAKYPMLSHIWLEDKFRVLDMLAVYSKTTLAVFSACLSGTGTPSESGDMLGFAHSMLSSGTNAYIGALWNSNDVATMIHMHFFYSTLFGRESRVSIASAWHHATIKLSKLTMEGAADIMESFIPTLQGRSENDGLTVKNWAQKLHDKITRLRSPKVDERLDFSHPYIWAPFVLVGNGSITLESSGAGVKVIQRSMPTREERLEKQKLAVQEIIAELIQTLGASGIRALAKDLPSSGFGPYMRNENEKEDSMLLGPWNPELIYTFCDKGYTLCEVMGCLRTAKGDTSIVELLLRLGRAQMSI